VGPPWRGGYLISLGFQPQAGAGVGEKWWWAPAPFHLGLKPQAGEYPPLQGGPPTQPAYRGTSPRISPSSPSAGYPTPRLRHWAAISGQVHSKRVRA
jgi:hypothetical protein